MLKKWTETLRRKIKRCYQLRGKSKTDYLYEDETVPVWIAPIILGIALGLFYGMYANYQALPKGLLQTDQALHPQRFIAESAQQYLQNLTSLGVRVGGSQANDEFATDLLIDLLEQIQSDMADSNLKLEFKKQFSYDETNFQLEFSPYGMTTVFKGCYNVLAKLSPLHVTEHGEYSGKCLLLNSHYDTMPDTDGASDAGAMIAVMLEVLRVLATNKEVFRHCIIFLFNGGEENYMLGSYSFVESSDWAKDVAAFINLDAAGAGGKEIMFQAGPNRPFLMHHYSQVAPHPHASVMGEELFQNNLIPSDSDYRIFRDFAQIGGMDFAFNANGYVYHTKYDTADLVPLGTLQHTGDNILALTRSLAQSQELYNVTAHWDDNVVFYDILGWFMLYYTLQEALLINLLVAGIGIIVVAFCLKSMSSRSGLTVGEIFVEVLISIGCHLVGICFGVGLVFLLAVIYDAAGRAMSWFSSPWILFGLYMSPFLATLAVPVVVWVDNFKRGLLSTSHQVQLYIHAQFLLLIVLLVVTTALEIRSAYVILVGVVFQAAAAFLNWLLGFQNQPKAWTIIHLIGQIIPIMFYGSLLHLALQTFIPITGRDGPDANPEILIALFCLGMALLMGGFIMPLVAMSRLSKVVLGLFAAIWAVAVILMATNVGFPYREATSPQRYWIYHTQRIYHGLGHSIERNESGFFMLAMDRHTPKSVEDYMLGELRSTEEDCNRALYCGLPLLSSRKHGKSDVSFWIPTQEPPVITEPTSLTLVNMEHVTERERVYTFRIEGPPHMGVFLSPASHMQMVNWTYLDNKVPESGPLWQGDRETYFIFYNYGYNIENKSFTFSVTIYSHEETVPATEKWLDIALVSHYLFHQEERTEEFRQFIDRFPEWTYVQAWTSTYESWQF